MTKSDLRTGEIVTFRNGKHYRVMLGAHCFCTGGDVFVCLETNTWGSLADYNDDLTSKQSNEFDIVKVEICTYTSTLCCEDYSKMKKFTIWEREEPKKLTLTEIEELLGYKVEIVGE